PRSPYAAPPTDTSPPNAARVIPLTQFVFCPVRVTVRVCPSVPLAGATELSTGGGGMEPSNPSTIPVLLTVKRSALTIPLIRVPPPTVTVPVVDGAAIWPQLHLAP